MIDIQNDNKLDMLKESMENSGSLLKEAMSGENIDIDYDDLTDESFADRAHRKFPIFSPGQAAISAIYMKRQKDSIPESIISRCKANLIAFKLRGIADILDGKDIVKEASDNGDDLEFILQSSRKLPVTDAEMLLKSASIFQKNINSLDIRERVDGSIQLSKFAATYGVDILTQEIKSYAMNAGCDLVKTAGTVLEREAATGDSRYRDLYVDITKIANDNGKKVYDSVILRDLSYGMMELDADNGILGSFNPILDVYNIENEDTIEKVASATVNIGSNEVSVESILSISDDSLNLIMGEEVNRDCSDADMITKVSSHIESLPSHAQKKAIEIITAG